MVGQTDGGHDIIQPIFDGRIKRKSETRTVRKSDYTPALTLPMHMACTFDKKCREKEKQKDKQAKPSF